MEDTLTESLETMNPEQLKSIVQKLFEIAKAAGIKTIDDISIKNYKSLIVAVPELYKLVNDENSEVPDTVKTLISSFINSINIEKIINYSLPDFEDALNTAAKKLAESREKSEAQKQLEKEEAERKRLERDTERKAEREKRQSRRNEQRSKRNSARNENREKRQKKHADKKEK